MRDLFNNWIDEFEKRFGFIVDFIALAGTLLAILISIYVFIMLIFGDIESIFILQILIPPGIIGFFSILMLLVLRIARHVTKEERLKQKD